MLIFRERRNLSRGVIFIGSGSGFSTRKSKVETSAGSRAAGEADRGLEHQRDLETLGPDASEAVGDLRRLGQRPLDRGAQFAHETLDVFARRVRLLHRSSKNDRDAAFSMSRSLWRPRKPRAIFRGR
jgi:hypothetical protein